MSDGEDRRQFYRVTDRVTLRYTRLRDEAAVASAQARLSLQNRLLALDLKEYPDDATLNPLDINISAIVKVLSSDTIDERYRLRTEFEQLPESDRERVIRHILSVQSRNLRQRRRPPPN